MRTFIFLFIVIIIMHLTEILVLLAMIISSCLVLVFSQRLYDAYVSSHSYRRYVVEYLSYINQTISDGSFAIIILPHPVNVNFTQYSSIIIVVKK